MKNKRKILGQIIPIFLIILIPAIAVIGYRSYLYSYNMYLEEQGDLLWASTNYVKDQLQSYANYEWLLKYWTDNCDELDVVYDDPEHISELKKNFVEKYPEYDLGTISQEELALLPDEGKKEYAEICFMDWVIYFNDMKGQADLRYFYIVNITDDMKEKFLVCGAKPGESRANVERSVYLHGYTVDFDLEGHPDAKKIIESHTSIKNLEPRYTPGTNTIERYNIYVPMDMSDQSTFLIITCLDATQVRNGLIHNFVVMIREIIIILIVALMIMACAFYLTVLRPVNILQKATRKYAVDKNLDKLKERLGRIKTKNEINQLADDTAELAEEMVAYLEETNKLVANNQRIETELGVATAIQTGVLPVLSAEFKDNEHFGMAASMTPAKEVGGDFYDFFKIDDNHLCLVIADVSGKGIPAAMFMMTAMSLIRMEAQKNISPADVLMHVNDFICERNETSMFVTVWIGILDLTSGKMITANAGHEKPIICRAGGEYQLIEGKHGLVLAAMEGMMYKNETLSLKPGDKLFLYTDGVVEATDSSNELFGYDRTLTALNSVRDKDSSEVLVAVKGAIDEFVGDAPQFDDITMIGFEYRG